MKSGHWRGPRAMLVLTATVVVAVGLLAGCDEDDVERSIGTQTAMAVESEYGVNPDPVLSQWVDVMGHRLVGQSPRQSIEYHFKVINTDMVNAFAAPWGYVYITRGMMAFAGSEDELAYITGHEIGHVANRDAIKSVKKGLLFSLGSALLGTRSESMGQLTELGAGLMLLHYSREDERDADVSGAATAYAAGYDPAAGEAFFARLMSEVEKDSPSSIEHLFRTHPDTKARIAALRARPETNLGDPVVASHIGRGYARRYAFGAAARYYLAALERKPEAVATRLSLADAYGGQGLLDKARETYEAVLARDNGNARANLGLQGLLAIENAPEPPSASSQEQQTAGGLLNDAYPQASAEIRDLLITYQKYDSAAGGRTANATKVAKQTIGSLLGFADLDVELAGDSQSAFAAANAAVSAANDSAFTLESLSDDLLRVRDMASAADPHLHQALVEVAAGRAQAGDLATYLRALAELGNAARDLQTAAEAAQGAAALVDQATASGADTVAAMTTMLRSSDPARYVYPVQNTAKSTQSTAAAAKEAVKKAKATAVMAEARALLARLNLASLGLSPEVRDAYDGLVAYFCNAQVREVRSLRERGFGYGDAAFLLNAAGANYADVQSYLGGQSNDELISSLGAKGVSFEGPVMLLRLLLARIDQEAAARAAADTP